MTGDYFIEIEISALDCPPVRRQFKLRFANGGEWPVVLDPITKLEQSAKDSPKPGDAEMKLTEDQVKVLLCLAGQDYPVIGPSIASVTKLSSIKTQYCLTALWKEQYICANLDDTPTTYELDQKGRQYLIERNLVK